MKYMKHLIQTTLLPAVISECQAFNQAVNPLQAQTLPHFLIYPALLNGLAYETNALLLNLRDA